MELSASSIAPASNGPMSEPCTEKTGGLRANSPLVPLMAAPHQLDDVKVGVWISALPQ